MMASITRKQKNSGSNHVSIGVDIVCDILSRLPVKTLLRFKCVSKQWLSLIQYDSYFIDLHHTQSKSRPCFLFAVAVPQNSDIWQNYQTGERRRVVPRIFNRTTAVGFDPSFFVRYLKPVNGLLCVVEFLGIRIYNISTRKLTPLIATTTTDPRRCCPVYQLGFDPATKEHKVICIWTSYDNLAGKGLDCLGCQVLTVGENSTWRMIDECVPDNYHIKEDASVYANGSIYWITAEFMNSEEKVIVAFDVGNEKFRKVIVPKFATLDYDLRNQDIILLEVNDRIALLYRLRGSNRVKLWLFDGTGGKGSCIQSWTERTINLYFQWDSRRCVEFLPIPGTKEILIENYERPVVGHRDTTRVPFFFFHSYNWESMTLKEESIQLHPLIPVLRHHRRIKFISSPYCESLFPVLKN